MELVGGLLTFADFKQARKPFGGFVANFRSPPCCPDNIQSRDAWRLYSA